jgi:signal transduction histidine kinase
MAIEHQRAEEELRSSEERLSLLQAITMEVTVAPDLPAAFAVVLRHVCEKTGWVFGQAWIPRNDRTALECSSAWFNADDEALREFRLGSEHTRLPMGVGLPGRVWLVKKSAWVSDVTVDSNFPRIQLARESGLKSALALPILSGDEVIGVIEFFMRERRREDERLIKVITAVAAQLDLAIERKRAEEALRQTEAELAHVSRVTTMGELAASIAHEVNQPLGAIVGNADICLHWLSGERPDLGKLREALHDISHDGRRASAVISRIRGLVKKNVPHKSMLDLNELAIESQALVEHDAHRKGVALVKELADALPLVHGDRVQLQQVLLNLMMNGMDAMVDVERESRQLTLITTHDGKTALIAVRDSGVGIEPQDVDRVFKPFHTTKSGGMGMGLAISRSIVEAHGGRLWLERNVGRGMTFKLMLPAGTPV